MNENCGLDNEVPELRAEVIRLRAALQRIVNEADSDDGLTAWDGSDIARAALREESRRADLIPLKLPKA